MEQWEKQREEGREGGREGGRHLAVELVAEGGVLEAVEARRDRADDV